MEDKFVQTINHNLLQARELYYANMLDKDEMIRCFEYENKKYKIQLKKYKTIKDGVIVEWFEGYFNGNNIYKIDIEEVD